MRRDQLNRRTHRTSLAAKAERRQSPQIIQRGRAVRAGGGGSTAVGLKLFRIDSNGTGRGVYKCKESVFDSTDWDSTSTIDKFGVTGDWVYVFNIGENYSAVANVLVSGDYLVAWQHTDDESNVRWLGFSPKYSWWHGGE